MLGIFEGADGLLRDPEGASVWSPTRLWHRAFCPGCCHSDEEDIDEGKNEEEEKLPY